MAEQSCMFRIHSMGSTFSDKERKVADYIVSRPSEAVHPSIEELAASIGVSVSTLLRFVKKLGYGGYQQFRIALATETLAPESRYYETAVASSEDPVAVAFSVARTALDMTEKSLDRATLGKVAAEACIAPAFYIFGLGGSGVVAKDAVHKFVRAGLLCQAAEDFHLQLMMASQAGPGDLASSFRTPAPTRTPSPSSRCSEKQAARSRPSPPTRARPWPGPPTTPSSPRRRRLVISEAFSARIAHLAIIDAIYIEVMETLKEKGLKKR